MPLFPASPSVPYLVAFDRTSLSPAKHLDIHYSLSPGARERKMQTLSSLAGPSSDGYSLFRIVAECCSTLEFYKRHVFNGKTAVWDHNTMLSYLYLIAKNL